MAITSMTVEKPYRDKLKKLAKVHKRTLRGELETLLDSYFEAQKFLTPIVHRCDSSSSEAKP